MNETFAYDVFLSHSSKDKPVVRELAERLRADGLCVWFDEWAIQPGDHIQAKVEEGLESSRVLVLCMSANAFDSDWAQLESYTFRFRDPLNRERRFLSLRLDDAPIPAALAAFLYLDWREGSQETAYFRLRESCIAERQTSLDTESRTDQMSNDSTTLNGHTDWVRNVVWSPDGRWLASAGDDGTVRIWDVDSNREYRRLEGHAGGAFSVTWSPDGRRLASAERDGAVRLWHVETGRELRRFASYSRGIKHIAWSPDGRQIASGGSIGGVSLWDVEGVKDSRQLKGYRGGVNYVAWSPDGQRLASVGDDGAVSFWDAESWERLRRPNGLGANIRGIAWSPDGRYLATAGSDGAVRLWNYNIKRELRRLEGHTDCVNQVAWSPDGKYLASASFDHTIRLWSAESGWGMRHLDVYEGTVLSVEWSPDGRFLAAAGSNRMVRLWNVSRISLNFKEGSNISQVEYTNAKVLLVGESGAGKTGLSRRLAADEWEPTDSTVGAWATQWKLPVDKGDGVEREIWLWDFGGQADQRLIHQLYMDETALAVLIFDGQKEDLFETLGQWDRDLSRLSGFAKLLVAGRVDAGGLRVPRNQVEAFVREHDYIGYLETSAKQGNGCVELGRAIVAGIDWDRLPWRTSPLLFKRLKEEIVALKDEGRVLMRFNELREALGLRLSGEFPGFRDEELRAVLGLLAGPGVVWQLGFGSWVLLQPERINAYAQAVIQTLRQDEHERGCLAERRVLDGDLAYAASMARLSGDEERFVLLAMHQTLVERGLCLREETDAGTLLVFPSYYRRERPELEGHPAVLVSYRFVGFLDDVYATLVVRLHHTAAFKQERLWRYAADFRTMTGKLLGVKLVRRADGVGELEAYFDPAIPEDTKIVFARYVHDHLRRTAKETTRLRHYVCPHCGTTVGNREVAMRRLEGWLEDGSVAEPPSIVCVECERRVPLWDDFERAFASDEVRAKVRKLEERAEIVLDAESKERALVGDVISTVALAGQIGREKTVSDHGIDMEIEFKTDMGEATGQMVLLQLKSGDSHLRRRKDGSEVFDIKDERHARYWASQAFPVILVIRDSDGVVRWMEIGESLRRSGPAKSFVFTGERFDVMAVRRWRDEALRERG